MNAVGPKRNVTKHDGASVPATRADVDTDLQVGDVQAMAAVTLQLAQLFKQTPRMSVTAALDIAFIDLGA